MPILPQTNTQPATARQRKFLAVAAWVLLATAPLWFLGAGHLYQASCEKEEAWTKAEATVTKLVAEQGSKKNSTVYYPVFDFTAANGQTYSVKSNHGSNPSPYEQGERISILYSEEAPSEAVIHSFMSLYLAPLILSVMGAGEFMLGGILLYASRRRDLRVSRPS